MWTIALAFLLALPLPRPLQNDDADISAITQQKDGSLFTATGNVVVLYQDIRVEADWVKYDEATQELEAGDSVHFIRSAERLDGTHLMMNLRTKAGSIQEARGNIGPGFFITAEEAIRLEDGRYELHNATITNCDEPRMGWMFTTARSVVDPNRKRVSASGAVFRFERVPVFYLPYMLVPTSDRPRATGFLIPSTSTSTTKGRSVSETFYYAINRSADATFTGEYFTKRGPVAALSFRAVPNVRSSVLVNTLFAQDRAGQGGQSIRILTSSDLSRGYRAVADLNIVSSLAFRQVYEEGFNVISSPIEHSLGFLTNNQPHSSVNLLYDRTAIFFPDPEPSVALRKFPSVDVQIPSVQIEGTPAYFSLGSGFAGLARRDAAIHTPTLSERFDLYPTLSIPILANSAVEWSTRFGVRETAYTHSINGQVGQVEQTPLNRLAVDYSMRIAGPHLERNFGSWRHVIEPSVEYRYVTGADRFRDIVLVDDVDLFTNTNEIEYAITNRIVTNREILSWNLAQKIYFDPTFGGAIIPGRRNVMSPLLDLTGFAFADGERRLSPLVSTVRIGSTSGVSTDLQVDYDTESKEFRNAGIIGGLTRGAFFSNGAYFFTRRSAIESPNNQLRGTLGYGNNQKRGLSTAFSFSYDIQRSLFQGSTAQVGYNTDCYGLSLEFSQFDIGARKESRFRFAFSLKDIGSFGTIRPQERLF